MDWTSEGTRDAVMGPENRLEGTRAEIKNGRMKFSFGRSILRKAIERGLASGKLEEELRELDDLKLKSRSDAEAVCWGLEQLRGGVAQLREHTYALALLFQKVEDGDCDAVEVFQERGIPELLRLYDEIQSAPSSVPGGEPHLDASPTDLARAKARIRAKAGGDDMADTLLFLLKIFALYATTNGTLKIIEAARQPLKPEGYMWEVILGSFSAGHPQNELLYGSLRDPLPPGFMAIALLDAANQAIIGGEAMSHPFDSPEGKARLKVWLTNRDDEEYSYAHSATAALPAISNPERDLLLELAMQHPDQGVRLEAMWAAAKLGRQDGFHRLAEFCRDFKTADVAKRYLSDLGREDLIPAEAKAPDFAALAAFAQWSAHPNELGRMPDELEIVDQRLLPWPPERKPKPFWLLKYRLRPETALDDEQVGCGLVGSVTWSFFSYDLEQRPPEDAYAIHCYWEMEQHRLIDETALEQSTGEYESLLQQWHGPPLKNVSLLSVAEISPELHCPQRLVGLASASLGDEEGWVVLDGERSEWFPRADLPSHSGGNIVLKIHVGSQLLGLTGKRDRKKFLHPSPSAAKPPEQVIAAYEKLLAEAKRLEGEKRQEFCDSFGPLGQHLQQYAEALVWGGRASELRPVIEMLKPHWNHPTGFGELGRAAWKTGQFDIAEEFFLKLRKEYASYERSREMDLLAELWCRHGRPDAAKELLLDCLRRLLEESKTAEGSDKRLFEEWFQSRRSTFLKLLPDHGNATLTASGIPDSTLLQPGL